MADVKSVNDQIHEDLISHDIDLQRLIADCKRRAEKRLDRLVSDLADLTRRIDPFGTQRTDARKRRVARLERETKVITDEAYRDIAKENKTDLNKVARIEMEKQIQVIGEKLP